MVSSNNLTRSFTLSENEKKTTTLWRILKTQHFLCNISSKNLTWNNNNWASTKAFLTLYPLGNFSCFFNCHLQNQHFGKILSWIPLECQTTGLMWCQVWYGSKRFAKVISRRHSVGNELIGTNTWEHYINAFNARTLIVKCICSFISEFIKLNVLYVFYCWTTPKRFLGWISARQRFKCFAQELSTEHPVRLAPATPLS